MNKKEFAKIYNERTTKQWIKWAEKEIREYQKFLVFLREDVKEKKKVI